MRRQGDGHVGVVLGVEVFNVAILALAFPAGDGQLLEVDRVELVQHRQVSEGDHLAHAVRTLEVLVLDLLGELLDFLFDHLIRGAGQAHLGQHVVIELVEFRRQLAGDVVFGLGFQIVADRRCRHLVDLGHLAGTGGPDRAGAEGDVGILLLEVFAVEDLLHDGHVENLSFVRQAAARQAGSIQRADRRADEEIDVIEHAGVLHLIEHGRIAGALAAATLQDEALGLGCRLDDDDFAILHEDLRGGIGRIITLEGHEPLQGLGVGHHQQFAQCLAVAG